MGVYADVLREHPSQDVPDDLPFDPSCRFRAEPHLL